MSFFKSGKAHGNFSGTGYSPRKEGSATSSRKRDFRSSRTIGWARRRNTISPRLAMELRHNGLTTEKSSLHSIDDPKSLIAWRIGAIQEISPKYDHGISTDRLPSSSTATAEERKALQQAEQDAHHAAEAEIQLKADEDYYILQSAFSASNSRCGPCLDLCLDLLLCEKRDDKYRPMLIEKFTSCEFFDYQITGAIGLVLKLFGGIDAKLLLSATGLNPQDPRAERVSSAAEKLRDLQIYGAMIADGTGFGKTKQCLLAALLFSFLTTENKPALLITPTSVIYQWLTEIQTHWLGGLHPILSYGRFSVDGVDELSRKEMAGLSRSRLLASQDESSLLGIRCSVQEKFSS
ncbi:SNF2-like protein [Penicillium freii]|nr:SNF2-like protein [Penicillium freii]